MIQAQRRALAVGSVLAAALSLAACSSNGFQSSGAAGATKTANLRLLVNISPALTKQFYQGLVAPYEAAHPGIKITIEAPTGTDVNATLQQELAAGTEPDLVSGDVGTDLISQLSELPAQPWVQAAPYAEQSKLNGKVWQVGSGDQVQSIIFYNKTAFAKAGITAVPTSMDQYTQDLVKLKGAGYVPLQTAGEWVTGAQLQMLTNPNLLGPTPDWFSEANKKAVTVSGSTWAKVTDIYQSWIKQGLTPKNAMGLKYQDSINEFLAGKSATYPMGSWFVPTADAAKLHFKVGVFPVPTLDGSPPPVAGSPSIPWSVLKSSKNQSAALALVQYLVSDKTAVTAELKAEGNFRSGFSYPGSALNQAVAAIVAQAKTTVAAASGQGDNAAPNGFGDEVNKVAQGLYVGDSAQSATKSLNSWYAANAGDAAKAK